MPTIAGGFAGQFRDAANQPGLTVAMAAAVKPMGGPSMMRTHMPALAAIALAVFCSQAHAQAQCLELNRLRGEAVQASKKWTALVPPSQHCETYIRISMAWAAIARYANDHREACDVSEVSLNEFEQRHREAVTARDNFCSGRPVRPYPAEIIQR
jgi:hypothetical protein